MIYNKLVRDKIPDIIEQNGQKPVYRMLSREEFHEALKTKLVEEANELLNAKTPEEELEELADIFEVLMFLVPDRDQVQKAAFEKRMAKGWFARHIFLESVEDTDNELDDN